MKKVMLSVVLVLVLMSSLVLAGDTPYGDFSCDDGLKICKCNNGMGCGTYLINQVIPDVCTIGGLEAGVPWCITPRIGDFICGQSVNYPCVCSPESTPVSLCNLPSGQQINRGDMISDPGIICSISGMKVSGCTTISSSAISKAAVPVGIAPVTPTPATPTGVVTTAAPVTLNVQCQNVQRCNEIDYVWAKIISGYVNTNYVSQIWNPNMIRWEYFPEAVSAPSVAPVNAQKIMEIALREWNSWNQGTLKEDESNGKNMVETKYFPAGKCSGTSTGTAWSAAFISYVMKEAGVTDFPVSCSHTTYFLDVKNGKSPSCNAHPVSQIDTVQVGDIVCRCDDSCDFNTIALYTPGHCDIVVERNGDQYFDVGGNRALLGSLDITHGVTVARGTKSINSLKSNSKYYGFIRCAAGSGTSTSGAVATSSDNELSVVGSSTITAGIITQVLTQANSPAKGSAQSFYDYGVTYGINPAIALAFFKMESNYGTDPNWVGAPNKNCGSTGSLSIGNIRVSQDYCTNLGGSKCSGANFCQYTSWDNGIKAWYKLLKESNNYIAGGKTTVDAIVPVYAPSSDNNNVNLYVSTVKKAVKDYEAMT